MEVKAGYKQTEVGVIPEDWLDPQLQEITEDNAPICYGIVKLGAFTPNGVPVLVIRDLNQDYTSDIYRSSHEIERAYTRSRIQAQDVLISVKGTTGRVGIVPRHFKGNISRDLARIRTRKNVDPKYVFQMLQSDLAQHRLNVAAVGTTRMELSIAILKQVRIPLPPTKAEQEAIAEALSDADVLIETLEQLIAKKRQVKQGAMQELMSGKKRLPGFSGEWKVKQFGDLGSTFGGLSGKTKADFGHGTARYITFMNIIYNTVIDNRTFDLVNVKPSEAQNKVGKGDLFFNGSSETPEEVGMCAVLLDDVDHLYVNSFCFGFRFRENVKAISLYFAYYFRSHEGRELMKSLAQGAIRYNLSKTALLKLTFPIPEHEEQTAIAEILSDMDAEITALEGKLSKAREVKQGMMSELLTGEIRLVES